MYQRGLRGMYISRRALRQQFDPRIYPKETYLLCKLHWGVNGRTWIHWARSDEVEDCHVEEYFLEQIFEPRNYSFCDMTWYLSWSPCADCCDIIQDFLEDQPNVRLDIRVARIYYAHVPRNCAGLRELALSPTVNIQAMDVQDHRNCWDTFLQREGYFDFTDGSFRLAIERSRSTLEEIFAGLNL